MLVLLVLHNHINEEKSSSNSNGQAWGISYVWMPLACFQWRTLRIQNSGKRLSKCVWYYESFPVFGFLLLRGVKFSSVKIWDKHTKSLVIHNKQELNGLYWVLHNFAVDYRTHRHVLMALLQPSLKYGYEMWNTNKCQPKSLESI